MTQGSYKRQAFVNTVTNLHAVGVVSLSAEELLAFQDRLCAVELVGYVAHFCVVFTSVI
jgi:hypothetical protein